jgi:hypothetical protein
MREDQPAPPQLPEEGHTPRFCFETLAPLPPFTTALHPQHGITTTTVTAPVLQTNPARPSPVLDRALRHPFTQRSNAMLNSVYYNINTMRNYYLTNRDLLHNCYPDQAGPLHDILFEPTINTCFEELSNATSSQGTLIWSYFLSIRFAELIFDPRSPYLALHPNFLFYRHLMALIHPDQVPQNGC